MANSTYFVVDKFSGSTCMCGTLAHVSDDCGHKHKTEAAAEACRTKLVNYNNGHCSAHWAYSKVSQRRRSDGARAVWVPVNDNTLALEFDVDVCRC